MAIQTSDIKWKKSEEVSDDPTNGGGMSSSDVTSAYLPDISGAQRLAGHTRYRKLFAKQEDADGNGHVNLTLNAAKCYLKNLSPAEDYFRLYAGDDSDVQSAAAGYAGWAGVGSLVADYATGVAQILADCENNDGFEDGAQLILFDAQNPTTIFEIIDITTVTWISNQATINLGANLQRDWDRAAIEFSAPTTVTTTSIGKVGIDLGAVDSKVGMFVRITAGPGAGQIRRITANTTEIMSVNYAWDPLDMPTVGSTVEIISTVVAQLIDLGDLVAYWSAWVETNVHAGTFDEATYPLQLFPVGSTSDDFTIQFTAPGICNVLDGAATVIATGVDISTAASIKPANGASFYFELDCAGFDLAANWDVGDSITFTTKHSAAGFWIKHVTPAGAAAHAGNRWDIGIAGDTA